MTDNIDTGAALVKTVSLPELAHIICTENAAAVQAAQAAAQATQDVLTHVLAAGRALIAAQQQVPERQWGEWLRANCADVGERHTRKIMALVHAYEAHVASGHTVAATDFAGLSLRGLMRRLTPSKRRQPPSGQAGKKKRTAAAQEPQQLNSLTFTGAPLAARRHIVDAIGWQTLAEAIPEAWYPSIQQWLRERLGSDKPAAVIDQGISDDLSIPTYLQREQPKPPLPAKATTPLVTPVYDVGHQRSYCGPTAMSAVTGESISTIRDAVRQASGQIQRADGSAWPVTGVATEDMVSAMRLLGWQVAEQCHEPKDGKPYTLDAFARDHGHDGPFIVNVAGHYVAISQSEFCDPFTVLPKDLFGGVLDRPWFGDRKRKGSTWVRKWWRFEKLPAADDGRTQ